MPKGKDKGKKTLCFELERRGSTENWVITSDLKIQKPEQENLQRFKDYHL